MIYYSDSSSKNNSVNKSDFEHPLRLCNKQLCSNNRRGKCQAIITLSVADAPLSALISAGRTHPHKEVNAQKTSQPAV